jgi:hypothetical protein
MYSPTADVNQERTLVGLRVRSDFVHGRKVTAVPSEIAHARARARVCVCVI